MYAIRSYYGHTDEGFGSVVSMIGTTEALILFNVFNYQRRLVDNRIFRDAAVEIDLVAGLDKFPQPDRRFDIECFGI